MLKLALRRPPGFEWEEHFGERPRRCWIGATSSSVRLPLVPASSDAELGPSTETNTLSDAVSQTARHSSRGDMAPRICRNRHMPGLAIWANENSLAGFFRTASEAFP